MRYQMLSNIAIAGIIGAGKTTLAEGLSKATGLPVFYEPVVENDYLELFYADMKTNAFPLQIYLLNKRFKLHQQLSWKGTGGIQDRSLYEDLIFANMLSNQGFIRQIDYETYLELFQSMKNLMCPCSLIVFLDVTPEESLRRIRLRNRECEKNITLEYLTDLAACYEKHIKEISHSVRVIRVKWDEFSDPKVVAIRIKEEYEKMIEPRYVTI